MITVEHIFENGRPIRIYDDMTNKYGQIDKCFFEEEKVKIDVTDEISDEIKLKIQSANLHPIQRTKELFYKVKYKLSPIVPALEISDEEAEALLAYQALLDTTNSVLPGDNETDETVVEEIFFQEQSEAPAEAYEADGTPSQSEEDFLSVFSSNPSLSIDKK